MAHVHSIGEPENESEAAAIRHLAAALPKDWFLFHNFELTTGHGLPYEYDLAVLGDFVLWHVEVKGYRGTIKGTRHHWEFENGGISPSPIPLANKKSKILAGALRRYDRRLEDVWVDTAVLLTDSRARVRLHDEQAGRVLTLADAAKHLTDPASLPVQTNDIRRLQDAVATVILGMSPRQHVHRIGLYDIVERISQRSERTVFLAKHRYIRTRPRTILKVFHFDLYAGGDERRRQIESIFHDQDAMRMLGAHPNLIRTGDMFAWGSHQFVLPTEFIEGGRPLRVALQEDAEQFPKHRRTWHMKAQGFLGAARGLAHCHAHGVIHRDVRPMNIVVAPAPDGGAPTVKLVNFDLALIRDNPDVQRPRKLMQRLNPAFTAPEVYDNPEAADARSDIFSMGISFHEVLTGHTPYDDVRELTGEIPIDRERLVAELSDPDSINRMDAPQLAADVILRMCRRDPAQRYPSMQAVIDDLAILSE
ncbi:MAG: hypothetical protein DRQ55_01840 [Planctomycetota bacterium]|nr:MAG: hypothetical protein DRQ55_01840 [Planctomycetota bacterium]